MQFHTKPNEAVWSGFMKRFLHNSNNKNRPFASKRVAVPSTRSQLLPQPQAAGPNEPAHLANTHLE